MQSTGFSPEVVSSRTRAAAAAAAVSAHCLHTGPVCQKIFYHQGQRTRRVYLHNNNNNINYNTRADNYYMTAVLGSKRRCRRRTACRRGTSTVQRSRTPFAKCRNPTAVCAVGTNVQAIAGCILRGCPRVCVCVCKCNIVLLTRKQIHTRLEQTRNLFINLIYLLIVNALSYELIMENTTK